MNKITQIAVLGAGTMGHAIASEFGLHGYKVNLFEEFDGLYCSAMKRIEDGLRFLANEGAISSDEIRCALDNITLYKDMTAAVKDADLVVESLLEDIELKQSVFETLGHVCKEHTIFATNTSSLTLSEIVKKMSPERQANCLVAHYYNPANIIPIIEISAFGATSKEVSETITQFYRSIGKHPVRVLKDVPGMVANRMTMALFREALHIIEAGITEPEDIDEAIKYGIAFRLAVVGQFGASDMGGLNLWRVVGNNLWPELSSATEVGPYLTHLVEAGKYGLKTGEGFYKYDLNNSEQFLEDFTKKLVVQLNASKAY